MTTRAGLSRETIVQVAAEMADRDGLDKLTMAALASRLEVRSPTLYHYLAGLAGLRRALALLGIEEVSARLGRSVMGKAGDEAVLALVHTLRDFAQERPGLYEAAQRAPDPDDPEWQAAGQEAVEIIVRTLSAYALSPDEALHVVRMIRIIVHGCVMLESSGGFGLPLEIDETFRLLLDSLLSYLHSQAS